jgi:hypothetical protein
MENSQTFFLIIVNHLEQLSYLQLFEVSKLSKMTKAGFTPTEVEKFFLQLNLGNMCCAWKRLFYSIAIMKNISDSCQCYACPWLLEMHDNGK